MQHIRIFRWSRCAASARRSRTARWRSRGSISTCAQGEFVSLLGPSGCGKSTALRIIAGLSEPSGAPSNGRRALPADSESRIGFVFQEPTLMPWASVFDNVLLPLKLKGVAADEARGAGRRALDRVGLQKFARAYPRELSGGMRMRVSIARALVTEPATASDGRAVRGARRDHAL